MERPRYTDAGRLLGFPLFFGLGFVGGSASWLNNRQTKLNTRASLQGGFFGEIRIFSLLLSISIIEWKQNFTFRATIANLYFQRGASPLGGDAGPNVQASITMQNGSVANACLPAMQGGILTALPPDVKSQGAAGVGDVMDLYPPNKIHATCDLCEASIPRYDGYRHALIGVKRVVCSACQSKLGLPLRSSEVYAGYRD